MSTAADGAALAIAAPSPVRAAASAGVVSSGRFVCLRGVISVEHTMHRPRQTPVTENEELAKGSRPPLPGR
jgi:hypothetical protein